MANAMGACSRNLFCRLEAQGDPLLRFEFAGEFANSKAQKFELQTSDGTKGTIELIPGAAFNLLEINVQIPTRSRERFAKPTSCS